jgi:dethiobiotin synthetase
MRLFVTGTDTGVGKTEIAVGLLRVMVARGLTPFACKPWESGGRDADSDATRLRHAAGDWQRPAEVCLYRLKAPLAPAIAAEREGRRLSFSRVVRHVRGLEGDGVVEGAGGLYVPVDRTHDVIDLVRAVKVPVVLVARAGLGTINHTSLSLHALEGVELAAVVLVQGTKVADPSVPTNRRALERRFPNVPFVGPVPFEPNAKRRAALVERAVEPIIASR